VSSSVLDASALLALANGEPGANRVATAVSDGAAISAVNLSEVAARLADRGLPGPTIQGNLDALSLEVVAFDRHLAYQAGLLRPLTRAIGLSLGDRACLALGQRFGLPVLTTDRAWATLSLGVQIEVIR
jgi:ribonuclease VapC